MRPRSLLVALAVALSLATALPANAQDTIPIRVRRIPLGDSVTSITSPRLSPDGRWIVASVGVGQPTGNANLWAVPAGGGAPIRLTSGNFSDVVPRWFPSGDRLVFVSNRASRTSPARNVAMVLSFDPATGRAVGDPRQISLDAIRLPGPGLAVSPDGRYVSYAEAGTNRVKVLPAEGGAARTIVDGDPAGNINWTDDGRHVLYTVRTNATNSWRLMRVPAAGGPAEELLSGTGTTGGIILGGRHLGFLDPVQAGSRTRVMRIADDSARVHSSYVISQGVVFDGWGGFSADGRQLVGSEVATAAWIRVASLMGGPITTLTSPVESYDWPLGWLAGDSVVIWREVRGRSSIIVKSARGGAERLLDMPPHQVRPINLVGGHIMYGAPSGNVGRVRLMAMDLATGESRQVFADFGPTSLFSVYGPGGSERPAIPDGFYYVMDTADRREVWEGSLSGGRRLLRSFSRSALTTGIGVHGNRLAYCVLEGDSARLVIADGPTAPPRRIATLGVLHPERERACMRDFVFSNNGRWLVTEMAPGQLLVVDTRAAGAEPPRVLDTGSRSLYGPAWLPDDSGITALSELPGPSRILLLSLSGGAPVTITQDDSSPKYGHYLSPSGRSVVYPAEVPQGSSIVIFELPTPLR